MMDALLRKTNSLVQRFRAGMWRFDLRVPRFFRSDPEVDRPIFLLGTQGGGLTLISRMLQRNRVVVTVWGDHRHWTGTDEMQNLLSSRLPDALSLKGSSVVEEAGGQDSWFYASDRLLRLSRRRACDATSRERELLLRALREVLSRYSRGRGQFRFLDKSQSYTVKVSFLDKLLEGCAPHFVLVTRNPYAVCRRAALKVLDDLFDDPDERLRVAAQHWVNSYTCALEDGEGIQGRFTVIRFEDVLRNPENQIANLCEFLGLEFDKDMLPAAHHSRPWGGIWDDKWYPLRPKVNEKYLQGLSDEETNVIHARCGDLAERFGYAPKGP